MIRDDQARWLSGGLKLARVFDEKGAPRAVPWIVETIGERLGVPPVGVIADLGALLHGEPVHTRAIATGDARLDAAIRKYEDAVLGPLARDRRVYEIAMAIEKLPDDVRARAVGIFTATLLNRIGYEGGAPIKPGPARALAKKPDLLEGGYAALRDERTRSEMAAGYEAIARGAKATKELVTDADVFVMENVEVLRDLEQRLAIEQLASAREALFRAMPRRIKSTRKSEGATATPKADESEYPAGGFSSISTSGSLENIVISELIYMEKGKTEHVDLFDLRYAEGELLYYTRDEAIYLRQRRYVTFVFGPELTKARVKDAGAPFQRLVLLFGVALAVIKKLTLELDAIDLRFRWVFARTEKKPSPLGAERALLELLLREERENGLVEILEATSDEEAARAVDFARVALVQTVSFSPGLASRVERLGLDTAQDFDAWSAQSIDLVASLL